MAGRPKGYAEWKPQQHVDRLVGQVEEILVEYRDYLPLTVRQIFYRLVGQYGYDKTERAYKRLCEYLVRARRAQRIPFNAIRDDGTTAYGPTMYHTPGDYWQSVRELGENYMRERMDEQDVRIELWCEAAGMVPQLAQVATPFGVDVYSTGGFSSVTVTREIAERALQADVPTVFLHVGDFDPSGQSIYEAMSDDARMFVLQLRKHRRRPHADITPVRVALTEEQVIEHDLPTAPPKMSDTRSVNWGDETCQAEAMAPSLLARIVGDALKANTDADVMEGVRDAEARERERIIERLDDAAFDELDDDE